MATMATSLFRPPSCSLRSSPLTIAANIPYSFRTVVCVAPSKSRGLAIRRASTDDSVRPEEEAGQFPIVFKDESNGIICYYDENGDLVCEGWDEGPHCQPDPQKPAMRRRRRFTPREMRARGMGR